MFCCSKDKEIPERTIIFQEVPMEERYIQKIERRLFEKKFQVLFENIEGGVQLEMLQWKLELIESSLSESNCLSELQFIEKFKKGRSYDCSSLILSYILLSELNPSVKATMLVELTEALSINLGSLIESVLKLSCEILPHLLYEETQINLYQITHYLTSLVLCKPYLELLVREETGLSPTYSINIDFKSMVKQSCVLKQLLSSSGVRLLLFEETRKNIGIKSSR